MKNSISDFSLKLPGLKDEVEILREPSGMVHIQAENEEDLFFSLGLVHTHDRLWQMDYLRRIASGTLAEVLGEDALAQDILTRTVGLYPAAESAYANLDPVVQQILETYTNGINTYIGLNLPRPLEFQILNYQPETWEPVDVIAMLKLQSFALSYNFQEELLRSELIAQGLPPERIETLFPTYEGDVTILKSEDLANIPSGVQIREEVEQVLPSLGRELTLSSQSQSISTTLNSLNSLFASAAGGSNNWVVSGDHTKTGKPFLANDSHGSLEIPSFWHFVHLESPELEVIGAGIAGLPAVISGHNNQIAWGTTNARVDVQDLYALVETENGYFYQGQELPYEIRPETIKVLGSEDLVIPVRETVIGPVISDALGINQPLALRWVSLGEQDQTIEAIINVNRAKNWTEFTDALRPAVAPSQNYVYADVEGNIGYLAPGLIPIRQPGHTGKLPVLGTGELDWKGFISFEQLPQSFNPERGYIISANNRIAPSEYPFVLGSDWAEPFRAERIEELILSKNKLSLKDMQAIQLDQLSLLFRDFKPVLEAIKPILKETKPESRKALRWLNKLLSWDGELQPNSRRATIFETWYNELTKLVATEIGQNFLSGEQLERVPRFLLQAFEQGDPICGGSPSDCLGEAAAIFQEIVTNFGSHIPRWGDIHQANFEHPIFPFNFQVPFGGDRYTVNKGVYDSDTFLAEVAPDNRQLFDLNNLNNSQFVVPPGQSGNWFSPFFKNLLSLWQQGKYVPLQTEDFQVTAKLALEPVQTNDVLLRRTLTSNNFGGDILMNGNSNNTLNLGEETDKFELLSQLSQLKLRNLLQNLETLVSDISSSASELDFLASADFFKNFGVLPLALSPISELFL